MRKYGAQHYRDAWAALALFGVFALGTVALLLAGTSVCRRVMAEREAASGRRACVQYVADCVRSADQVEVEVFGGVRALALRACDAPGQVTRVYYHDDYLMALTAADGEAASPEEGERVLPCNWMRLGLEDGLLTVDLLDLQGKVTTLRLSLRNREGGAA